MKLVVDLNADLGEDAGHDDELLALVTSANIACGFHAGDAGTMRRSIEAARDRKVAVGAHPSLFDRENFGRKELPVKPDEVFDAVVYQLGVFQAIAEAGKVRSVGGGDGDVRTETICLHGDNPEAVQFARALRSRLEKEGVSIRAPKFSK